MHLPFWLQGMTTNEPHEKQSSVPHPFCFLCCTMRSQFYRQLSSKDPLTMQIACDHSAVLCYRFILYNWKGISLCFDYTDHPEQLAVVAPALGRVVGSDDLQRSLLTSGIL